MLKSNKTLRKSTAAKVSPPQSRATIIDIARVAGVSKSTVSLVLQGSSLVRKETREAVHAVIEQLGYVYNRSAAGLRQAKSDFAGIVIGDLSNPFFSELAAGIEEVLAGHNMLPVLANANEDPVQQANAIRALREHGVAGIVLSPARGTTAWTISESFPKGLPVVVAMCVVDDCPFPYVGPDNISGFVQATGHLIALGHKSIAFFGGDNSFAVQKERIEGWRKAHRDAGLVADDRLIINSAPSRQGGAEAMKIALSHPQKPTAAVCHNDVVALGASRLLHDSGLSVGRDFSIVGFDDIAEAAYAFPPLTTVSVGTRNMGMEAAKRLVQLIKGEEVDSQKFLGETKLIVRQSTGPCKA
jgi:LacI family transcriptional regulator